MHFYTIFYCHEKHKQTYHANVNILKSTDNYHTQTHRNHQYHLKGKHQYKAPFLLNDEYVQLKYLQPIVTQYFIGNKSEIWSLSLIVHSKG